MANQDDTSKPTRGRRNPSKSASKPSTATALDDSMPPLDLTSALPTSPPPQTLEEAIRNTGCSNTRYLDGHHFKHWAHGGETKLSNLVSLCRFHHRQVHEGKVVVRVLDDGDSVRHAQRQVF